MRRVAVLGADGMLGSMLVRVLGENPGLETIPVTRRPNAGAPGFDARVDDPGDLLAMLGCDWMLNAIGWLRSRINESDPESVAEAFEINAEFPRRLASAAWRSSARIIHFGTDAVFSGSAGPYGESADHDGRGVYALSKSLGERANERVVTTLRCSFVGPERAEPRSLLGWAISQPPDVTIDGYTDLRWNGVTSLHLARLCEAIVSDRVDDLPSPMHVVPADAVSKAELLELALAAFGRDDVTVRRVESTAPADLTLATMYPEAGQRLWAAAEYERPPTVAEMLNELAHRVRAGTRRLSGDA